jgi:hypothetical protein
MNITNAIDTINTDIVLAVFRFFTVYGEVPNLDLALQAMDALKVAKANGVKKLPVDAYELKAIFKDCDDETFAYLYKEVHRLNFLNHIRTEQ